MRNIKLRLAPRGTWWNCNEGYNIFKLLQHQVTEHINAIRRQTLRKITLTSTKRNLVVHWLQRKNVDET